MLRSTIARKVFRLRSIRSLRSYQSYESPNPLPILTDLPPSSSTETSRPFPLYQPPPRGEYIPLTKETLAQLPSDESLSRQLKTRLTKKAIEHLPELEEDDLKRFYKDLVRSGLHETDEAQLRLASPEEMLKLPMSAAERDQVLKEVEGRLFGTSQQQMLESSNAGPFATVTVVASSARDGESSRHARLTRALSELAVPESPGPSGTSKLPAGIDHGPSIPLGLLSRREWKALFEESIAQKDARAAEALLDVMTLHGVAAEEQHVTEIMRVDAEAGRVEDVGRLTMELAESGLTISDKHKDLLILALLQRTPSRPDMAITQLLSAEAAGQPYPQSSYHIAISHLTRPSSLFHPNAHTRAMAWDLFTQMRFAAHPTPSRELYTAMIRTCAESTQPEPERARDLWIEMTQSEKMEPMRDEYSAIIRALGSTKKDYLEAFDLLRQMLAKHHDATFVPFADEDSEAAVPKLSAYVPTPDTFTALLEGTKRAGDLNRARWVLTEAVKLARTGQVLGAPEWHKGVDEDLLSGVFMTYAAWKPVIRRHALKVRDGQESGKVEGAGLEADGSETGNRAVEAQEDWLDVDVLEELVQTSPAGTASQQVQDMSGNQTQDSVSPLSSADAIREVDALFERVLEDAQTDQTRTADFLPFKGVRLSPKLLNSYISVHLTHGPSLASAKEAYERAWSAASAATREPVRPNGWTLLQILERCSAGNRGGVTKADRQTAFTWGQGVWAEYRDLTKFATGRLDQIVDPSTRDRKRWLFGLGERQVERAWRAAIRLFALHGETDTAMALLTEFFSLYPPSDILETYAPIPEVGFKVRMTTAATTPEAQVPPYLLFDDVNVLHSRLVKEEKFKDIAKVKAYVCAYERKLVERRKWRMKGHRQGREIQEFKQKQRMMAQMAREALEAGAEEHEDELWGYEDEASGRWARRTERV